MIANVRRLLISLRKLLSAIRSESQFVQTVVQTNKVNSKP